jgi:filamentous hemagglutinin family protein
MKKFHFLSLVMTCPLVLFGQPSGASVASGEAGLSQNGTTLEILTSDRAIINWDSFSIAQEEGVRFIQPSETSAVLNRVTGSEMSLIDGCLNANGQVYLINPQGIIIGDSGIIDCASLVLSTLNVENSDFLAGKDLRFEGSSQSPLINLGTIETHFGNVILIGHLISNKADISASHSVALLSSHDLLLKPEGDNFIYVRPDLPSGGIENQGTIEALRVQLEADGAYSLGIRQEGSIKASEGAVTFVLNSELEDQKPIYQTGTIDVSGDTGGTVSITAPKCLISGSIVADGHQESGGTISITTKGAYIATQSSLIRASGRTRGGAISIHSQTNPIYSSGTHTVEGNIGGKISLSGHSILMPAAILNVNGKSSSGQVSLHGSCPTITQSELIDPNQGGGTGFGTILRPLSTGNIVVTKPGDNFGATNAGAVYVYNGSSGALISSITGSSSGDQIGSTGITVLTNGNFIIQSASWDNGSAANAGAATWASGSSGVSGVVSSSNSLIGSTANDAIGNSVTALTNGNYVVTSPNWDNGGTSNVGAVTWGSGTSGVSGTISSSNSLIGSTSGDAIGSIIIALTNGNYVTSSGTWNNGGLANAGAATWGSGTTGITGVVSSSNSLVGPSSGDFIGNLKALTNGNYVVYNSLWHNGVVAIVGAATWCNGSTGRTGNVTAGNSLIGSASSSLCSSGGVIALSNGNYVVLSPDWDNGLTNNVGAATWGNGATGTTGVLSSSNSLIGSTAGDRVGSSCKALANGNYVVISPEWNNGGATTAGAVTLGNGTSGTTGAVSSSNSLVGSTTADTVGFDGVTALTNGNYVVISTTWANGIETTAGAVTFGNGTTGVTGAVSSSNSLVGSTTADTVGSGGIVELTNGNYVISSPLWNGAMGAATWGSGTSGVSGVLSSSNSFISDTGGLSTASNGCTALANGNYFVNSAFWSPDGVSFLGAITWCDGSTGRTGVLTSSNSLTGSVDGDWIGSGGIIALSNGDGIALSPAWNNGVNTAVGAITYLSGTRVTSDVVSSTNSIIGSQTNQQIGSNGSLVLSNGDGVVISPDWGYDGLTSAGAATLICGETSGFISNTNSLIGQASSTNLISVTNDTVNQKFYAVFLAEGSSGRIRYTSYSFPSPSSSTSPNTHQGTINYLNALSESFQRWTKTYGGNYLSYDEFAPSWTDKNQYYSFPSLVR